MYLFDNTICTKNILYPQEKDTKMTYQNVSIVLSPTMQISHRVLNVLFLNHAYLFGNVVIKKYVISIISYLCYIMNMNEIMWIDRIFDGNVDI